MIRPLLRRLARAMGYELTNPDSARLTMRLLEARADRDRLSRELAAAKQDLCDATTAYLRNAPLVVGESPSIAELREKLAASERRAAIYRQQMQEASRRADEAERDLAESRRHHVLRDEVDDVANSRVAEIERELADLRTQLAAAVAERDEAKRLATNALVEEERRITDRTAYLNRRLCEAQDLYCNAADARDRLSREYDEATDRHEGALATERSLREQAEAKLARVQAVLATTSDAALRPLLRTALRDTGHDAPQPG